MSISENSLSLSFEEALQELESIVKNLEDGRLALEESLKLYERGSQLKDYCDQKLKAARLKIDEICADKEGAISIRPSSLGVE